MREQDRQQLTQRTTGEQQRTQRSLAAKQQVDDGECSSPCCFRPIRVIRDKAAHCSRPLRQCYAPSPPAHTILGVVARGATLCPVWLLLDERRIQSKVPCFVRRADREIHRTCIEAFQENARAATSTIGTSHAHLPRALAFTRARKRRVSACRRILHRHKQTSDTTHQLTATSSHRSQHAHAKGGACSPAEKTGEPCDAHHSSPSCRC
jgi:hypothetical protein